jgi:hypothetical protein
MPDPTLIRKRGIETLRTPESLAEGGRVTVTHYAENDPDECAADLNLSVSEALNLRNQLNFQLYEYASG